MQKFNQVNIFKRKYSAQVRGKETPDRVTHRVIINSARGDPRQSHTHSDYKLCKRRPQTESCRVIINCARGDPRQSHRVITNCARGDPRQSHAE